jgi:hypothetical protein
MKNIVFIFIILAHYCFAQNSPSSFFNNRCDFKTDGSGKSLGLKIKLSFPCAWKQSDGERPHVVKKFSYAAGTNSMNSTLTINEIPVTPSKDEINEMFTQKGLKELCGNDQTFVSGRKLKIDGIDCGEIVFKMTREHPVGTFYLYGISYFFVYENKMINLNYLIGSTTSEQAKKNFDNYITLFRALAGSTVFLSKWE